MANAKAVGPYELPVELLKLEINDDATVLREFLRVIKLVWHQREVPQRWRDAAIKVLHKKKDTGPRAVTIAAFHSWYTWVRFFSRSSLRYSVPTARRGTCCRRSSAGSARTKCAYCCSCVLSTCRRHTSVDRTLLWQVLDRFGAQPQMIEVTHPSPRWDESLRAK